MWRGEGRVLWQNTLLRSCGSPSLPLDLHSPWYFSFTVSVLSRHNQRPSTRHWRAVKHVSRYLWGTEDLGLHYVKTDSSAITGYADADYKSDVVTGQSQTGYIFLHNNAPISWRSTKKTITATSTNHSEIIAFHEATREAVWLRHLHKTMMEQSGLTTENKPTVIFEDNAACVAQIGAGFIKSDRTKHIDPQIFSYTQDLITIGQIEVQKVESAHNIADLLTKALPAYIHRRLVQAAGMRLLHELTWPKVYSFLLSENFSLPSIRFLYSEVVFNEVSSNWGGVFKAHSGLSPMCSNNH